MPAADGVDARARRVAARLLPIRVRRSVQGPARPGDQVRAAVARHAVGGHPARAARVARAVQALEPEGWFSLGRVHRPGGGRRLIDHLLIGPGGVVIIDSQAWVGRIEVTRGVVQQNGFWREPECAEVARAAGSIAALLLPRHRTAVHAVICVAQHDLAEHLVAPGVRVVGVTGLARVLRALPPRLLPAEIVQLHTHLRHILTDSAPPQLTTAEFELLPGAVLGLPGYVVDLGAPGPSPGAHDLFVPVARRSLRSAARSAARRRRPRRPRRGVDWRLLLARMLLAVLVAAGAVVLGPGLVHSPVKGGPSHPVVPLVPESSPSERPEPSGVTPPAATAREDHHPPPL